jgi:hypothetical protein
MNFAEWARKQKRALTYLGAVHSFKRDGNLITVSLEPDGRAYVNGSPVCEFVRPNTTKTRALAALKHYHERQKPNR